jgi:glutamate-5-semialdehyde dehydrogenase
LELDRSIAELGVRARRAARALAPLPRARKDAALRALAQGIARDRATIFAANAEDVSAAKAKALSDALVDRLVLDEKRLAGVVQSVQEIAELADPVGEVIAKTQRPNGLEVRRVRVPIGVIAMIYEARPNVTAEASALAIKSGNAIVLRGGSEALRSNIALAAVATGALAEAGLPTDAVQLLPSVEREAIKVLLRQTDTIDLVIPRGGEALIRFVTENARVPVVQHYKGVCHLVLDEGCDLEMARRLTLDGKLARPSACNALECLLVVRSEAARLLPPILTALHEQGCEIRGCEATRALFPDARPATDDDWGREFLDRILAVRVVESFECALAHIARYGSGHTEALCTPSQAHADRFRSEVDAACVVVNASTRFHDGGELGLGAELGIATSRLHWRGPMGLEALTTMKWIVDGAGQTRG